MTGTVESVLCSRGRKVDTRDVQKRLANGGKARVEIAGWCRKAISSSTEYSWMLWDQIWCLYSECERIVYFIKSTIPFEDAIDVAFERKKLKYAELVAELAQDQWS